MSFSWDAFCTSFASVCVLFSLLSHLFCCWICLLCFLNVILIILKVNNPPENKRTVKGAISLKLYITVWVKWCLQQCYMELFHQLLNEVLMLKPNVFIKADIVNEVACNEVSMDTNKMAAPAVFKPITSWSALNSDSGLYC